jgi:hypothetical protein
MIRRLASILLPTALAALAACAVPVPIAPPYELGASGVSPIPPAPRVPASVDPVVCTSSGADLMPSLNGAWTLEGGPRTVWGSTEDGSITLRLPGQEPVDMVFEYRPEQGIMHVRGSDPGEQMFLFAATEAQIAASAPLIDPEGAEASGPGCDWYDSPLFIGTNYYYAEEEVSADDTGQWLPACTLIALAVYGFDPALCRTTPTPSRTEFEMEMTLLVRFSGSGHASGVLYFEGTGEETELGAGGGDQAVSEFRARAEVELTR